MTTEITTVKELLDLPAGTIVRSSAGTIACRHPEGMGTVFGDERTFEWTRLALPAVVIYPTPAPSNVHRVGDPDPTPAHGLPCEETALDAKGARWYCTWDRGHAGDHVAGNGQIVEHAWPAAGGPDTVTDEREALVRLLSESAGWLDGMEDAIDAILAAGFRRIDLTSEATVDKAAKAAAAGYRGAPKFRNGDILEPWRVAARAALAVLNEEPGE